MKLFFKKNNQICPQCLKHSFYRRAFTLVETLVAISIFTMSILGMISILASGVSDISYAKQKIVASYLAQEGIECVRNIRDNYILYTDTIPAQNWSNFVTLSIDDSSCPNHDSTFTRTITKTKISDDEVTITSKVNWVQGSGTYSISFSEDLFNLEI